MFTRSCFNPRTYIRYDKRPWALIVFIFVFQSTYLYKVRHELGIRSKRQTGFNPRTYIRYDFLSLHYPVYPLQFQSTYLYKVRHSISSKCFIRLKFQSTYLYKVRPFFRIIFSCHNSFNPRTYIRYDRTSFYYTYIQSCFNPRTYIRYDGTVFCVLFLFYQFQSTYLYKVRQGLGF